MDFSSDTASTSFKSPYFHSSSPLSIHSYLAELTLFWAEGCDPLLESESHSNQL